MAKPYRLKQVVICLIIIKWIAKVGLRLGIRKESKGILVYIVSLVEEPILVWLLFDVGGCMCEEYPHFDLTIVDYVSGRTYRILVISLGRRWICGKTWRLVSSFGRGGWPRRVIKGGRVSRGSVSRFSWARVFLFISVSRPWPKRGVRAGTWIWGWSERWSFFAVAESLQLLPWSLLYGRFHPPKTTKNRSCFWTQRCYWSC